MQKRGESPLWGFFENCFYNILKYLVVTSCFIRIIETWTIYEVNVLKKFNVHFFSHCFYAFVSFKLLRLLWFLFLHFQSLLDQMIASGTFAISHFSKNKYLRYIISFSKLNWSSKIINLFNHFTKLLKKLFRVFNLLVIHLLNAFIHILDSLFIFIFISISILLKLNI